MPIVEKVIPCGDCDEETQMIKLQHWKFISCSPEPGEDGFCRIRYDDSIDVPAVPAPEAA